MLLIDQYELAMAASYLERGMNQPAVFELFMRELPPGRDWLLVAGASVRRCCASWSGFRFGGEIDSIPEGTIAFAGEPLVRVTAPRIEAQLLKTLLLNQINFQTAIATKAARIAGAEGTSNVAAAMRYGMRPVRTMAHSYVMSFADEQDAFRTFMQDTPENAIMLVDTYDTLDGVRHAIAASRQTAVELNGVRLDSGDLLSLSRGARALLDDADMRDAQIVASGDLEEHQIAKLVAAGAPIDIWGVGTELGTGRDAPALRVYKLVADRARRFGLAAGLEALAGEGDDPRAKQVFRSFAAGTMTGDLVAEVPSVVRGGRCSSASWSKAGSCGASRWRRSARAPPRTSARCQRRFAPPRRGRLRHIRSPIRSCCLRSGHSPRWAGLVAEAGATARGILRRRSG